MSRFNFAFIRYVDDGVTAVVPIENILSKKFNPDTFTSKKAYRVKYNEDEEYYAHILCLAETEEEVKRISQNKRIKIPAKKYTEYASTDGGDVDDDDAENILNNLTKNKSQRKSQIKTKAEIHNFNNVLLIEDEANCNNSPQGMVNDANTKEMRALNEKILSLGKKIDELMDDNRRLKDDILEKFTDIADKINKLGDNKLANNDNEGGNPKEEAPVGSRESDQIYFGRGMWVPSRCYDQAVVRCPNNDSRLIKELALCVFTVEELLSSSVTGAPCNKTKAPPKPALNPTKLLALQDIVRFTCQQKNYEIEKINGICKLVNTKVGEKIQDLLKPSKRKIGNGVEVRLNDVRLNDEAVDTQDNLQTDVEAVQQEIALAEAALL